MTLTEFRESLNEASPPESLRPLLRALWLESKGLFDQAHGIAQEDESSDGSRVHAYLHRKEGDLSNARYWYRRAGSPEFTGSLTEEWESLVRRML